MTPRQSSRDLSLIAILLLAGTTAFAQGMGQYNNMQQGNMQQSQAQQQPASTQANSMAANSDSGPISYADQAFVEDMFKDNDTQIEMSQLAQQKASSGDVKQFSERMIQIHTTLNQQLLPLAKKLDISEKQKPTKQEKKELDQLQQLSGTDFDTAYLQAMAKEQQHSLKALKNQESALNPMIQKTAKADEPILTQHYQILQKIAETHNVPLDMDSK
jgi:putative membrane protein